MYVFVVYYLGEKSAGLPSQITSRKNCFILSFMTYPVLFSFERANLENMLFIFIALSLYCYQKNNKIGTVMFLGLASALKLYPLLFIVLFIADKRYWEAIGTILWTMFLTFISLFILKPNWNQNVISIWEAIAGLSNNCINGTSCIQYSISLWASLKFLYLRYFSHTSNVLIFAKSYQISTALLGGIVVFFILVVEKQFWRKLTLVISAILLFPIVSNEYKMLYILLPLAYWINSPAKKDDAWYLILYALLLIPKNYYWVALGGREISINEFLNSAILCILMSSVIAQSTFDLCQRRKYEK